MTDLLPCPFCGKPTEYVCENDHHGDYFRLGSTDEDCPAHWTYYTEPQENSEECIQRWNTRPGIPAPAQRPEVIVGQLEQIARTLALADCREYILATSDASELHHLSDANWQEFLPHAKALVAKGLAAQPPATPVETELPPLADLDELVALLQDLASVNLSREACERQARRMADDLIARGLTFATKSAPSHTTSQQAEMLPKREPAGGGADTQCSAGRETELLATLVYEAMRFAIWAAGQGIMPDEGEPAQGPEDFLYEYSCALEIDDWEGLAEVARDHVRAVPQGARK